MCRVLTVHGTELTYALNNMPVSLVKSFQNQTQLLLPQVAGPRRIAMSKQQSVSQSPVDSGPSCSDRQ